MTTDQTKKLLQLFEDGYKVEIKIGGCVDNNFRIYEADEYAMIENNGYWICFIKRENYCKI